jgi:tetratricopeptide (TPR) repeat protein
MSNNFPKISPDGRWIVFVKNRNGQLMRPDSELYIIPATGGVARRMNCNTSRMNSWHSFSPNGRWMVFSSKSRSPYTQMFLTHIDAKGIDSPPIYIDNSTAANRAVNIPEFVNIPSGGILNIEVPVMDFYSLIDEALELEKQGDNATALVKWQKALEMNPNSAYANNGMGTVLGLTGKPEESISYFQMAIQIEGDFFEAYYNLGVVLTKEDKINEAIDAWRNTVRIRPKYAKGHESLGYLYYQQGKYADSLAELRLALASEPDRLFTLNLAATLLATCPENTVRNGAEAVALAERAKRLNGATSPAVLDTLSAAYAENGSFLQALETGRKALALAAQQGDTALTAKLNAHLAKYESNQPLREPPDASSF